MTDYEQNQAFGGVIDVLEAIGARYAIWGGVAVVAYGEPRFTQDMDILLSPNQFAVPLFVRRLHETHYHVDEISVNRAMGGGFFNVNSAHPFENATPLSNFFEMLAILLIPVALCYTFGLMVGDTRQGWAILAAMTVIFVALLTLGVWAEQSGNPRGYE